MDGDAWCRLQSMGSQSWTRLSDFTFTFREQGARSVNSGSLTTLLQRGTHAQVLGEGFHPQERQRCERAAGAARGRAPRSPQRELGTVSRPMSSTSWSGAPGCAQCRRTPSSASGRASTGRGHNRRPREELPSE